MDSVVVVAGPELATQLDGWFRRQTAYAAELAGQDLRRGAARAAEVGAVLLVEATLLREHGGWLQTLRDLKLPVVVIGEETADAFHWALRAGAVDFVPRGDWASRLEASLAQVVPTDSHAGPAAPVVAVFSPKGGVGKTTLAANLACALGARRSGPVALVDLDLQFGDLATLLNVEPKATLYDAVRLPVRTHEALMRLLTPVPRTAVALLAAPADPLQAEEIAPEPVLETIRHLGEQAAAVVVDTAVDYTDVNVAALDLADRVLLVVTPDVVTVRSCRRALGLFEEGFGYPPEKIQVVLNRDGSGIARREVEWALGRSVDYGVPSDGTWPVRAANEGLPLWLLKPESRVVRSVAAMAAAILPGVEPARRPHRWFGLPAGRAEA
jgi:pilus assembly protein CpaE